MNCKLIKSCLALLATCAALHAHSVWIEDTPENRLVVHFGDVGGKVEKSPGYLDDLLLTSAWTADQDGRLEALTIEKKDDHYLLGAATPGKGALAETNFFVMQRGQNPGIWPNLYVRWQPTGATPPLEPALTLDILPTGQPGEFRVYFRGQPLAGAVVRIVSQENEEGKAPSLTADAEGLIRFTPEQAGLVVLTSNHREKVPGFSRGKAYDFASHTCALSWRQP